MTARPPRHTRRALCALVALGLVTAVPSGQAQRTTVIYHCTDIFGRVSFQNDEPCPKGSKQDRRVIEMSAPTPAPAPPQYYTRPEPPPAAPPPDADGTATTDDTPPAPRPPPPPLFRCERMGEQFLSEREEPAPVCMRMTTVGIDGSAQTAAGLACEVPETTCQAVPDAELCDTWREHVREALAAWKFGPRERAVEMQGAYEAMDETYRQSHCHGADD